MSEQDITYLQNDVADLQREIQYLKNQADSQTAHIISQKLLIQELQDDLATSIRNSTRQGELFCEFLEKHHKPLVNDFNAHGHHVGGDKGSRLNELTGRPIKVDG